MKFSFAPSKFTANASLWSRVSLKPYVLWGRWDCRRCLPSNVQFLFCQNIKMLISTGVARNWQNQTSWVQMLWETEW
jgi:hypothetical protein